MRGSARLLRRRTRTAPFELASPSRELAPLKGRAAAPLSRWPNAALQALLTDARRGELPEASPRSGKTFGDAVAEWLRYAEHDKARRASTLRDYRNVANAALLPEFGAETPLEEITAERLDAYRMRLLMEGAVSRRTVQKLMVLLHGILKRARASKWIATNPAEDVERVNVPASVSSTF